MKAVRNAHMTTEMSKGAGISTRNHLVSDGVQGNYPTGPRSQVSQPEEPKPKIKVVYNDGKCYRCGGDDTSTVRAFTDLGLKHCNKCNIIFLANKYIEETEYVNLF